MTSRSRANSRRSSSQPSKLQLRVFSEGRKTESIYLTNWHRLYRDRVIVSIAPHKHTTPYELTESAVAERRSDLREASRGRGAAFDQYWCIFDVDEHPRIPEALDFAGLQGINVALSSPCLELWFLIHFDDQTAYLDRSEAQRRSKAILGCDKVPTQTALDRLVDNYDTAKSRARALKEKHIGDGSSQPWNPHTEVWRLVDVIKSGTAVA
jgi:RloB-like protein